jgi:hypothetical protein
MRLITEQGVAHEFRTTIVGPLLSNEDLAVVRTQIPRGLTVEAAVFPPRKHFHANSA